MATPPVESVVAQPAARVRLHFLDGLRALACLYVLFFHELSAKVTGHGDPSPFVAAILPHLNRGRFGVVFFIVLSGFSLMLPLARSSSLRLVGGFRNYIYRRAKRIAPPYYAALALSIAVIMLYNRIGASHDVGPRLDAALMPGSVLSHLLLLHNLTFEWAYRINGPMWSVATEWQIYFLFPALLLVLWRTGGGVVAIVAAWVLGSLPFFLLPPDRNFFWACPWFVGSFAFGMAGAVIGCDPKLRDSAIRNRVPWALVSLTLFLSLVAICVTGRADTWSYPVVDLVVSLLALSVICACIQASGEAKSRSTALAILGSRVLVYIGGFSYSLYLIQHPILRLVEKICNRLPLSYDANIALELAIGTPTVMAIAWVFSELFERPFTSGGLLLPWLKRRFTAAAAPAVR
jgi:peptidoglycan/LPS O-acetylase OafA/YrhL